MAPRVPKKESRQEREREADEHAKAALRALLEADLPPSFTLEGKDVELVTEYKVQDRRSVLCTWKNGRMVLRLSVRDGAVNVTTDKGVQCAYVNFVAYVLGALEGGETEVPFIAANAYSTRAEDRAKGRDISHYGPLSRSIAAKNGLPDEAMGVLGSYGISKGSWVQGARKVLEQLLKLSIIKAHLFGRRAGGAQTSLRGAFCALARKEPQPAPK